MLLLRHLLLPPVLFAGIALTGAPVQAALQPIAEAPLSGDAEFHCHFNTDSSYDCVSTYRYTILKPAGRQMLSRIDHYYPENDSLVVEKAELIQPGAKPVPLKASQIDTRMAPNPDQGYLREKQTSLAFPNLLVGTTIRYTLREHFSAKPLGTQFHYVLNLWPKAVRFDRMRAEFTAERAIAWRGELLEDYTIQRAPDGRKLVVELKKAPYYWNYINESDNGYLRRYPRLEIGSSLDLQDNFAPLAARYNEILAAPLPEKAAAAVLAVRGKSAAEQVAALMQYINDNYRYLGDWRESERGYIPFALSEIESHGYGDCKDLAILLSAMLKAAGVQAEPTLVRRGATSPTLLIPGLNSPDHAIVRADVDGKSWWLDPTNPFFVPGRIMPDLQQRWALVFGADSVVRQEQIPVENPDEAFRIELVKRFISDEKARVDLTMELANVPLMQLTASDRDRGRTSTDQDVCSQLADESTDCVLERGESQFTVPPKYQIKASLIALRALTRIGDKYFYEPGKLATQWDSFSLYLNEGQQLDLYLGSPETSSLDVTLAGLKVDEPSRSCRVRSRWYDIDMQGEPVSDGYRYNYRIARKTSWFSHEEISSAEFGDVIKQGRDCIEQLRLTARPLP